MGPFENELSFAERLDREDRLSGFRSEFHFPKLKGKDALYFAGNSLGLQPRKAREYVCQELDDWAALGVEGHLHARKPWLPYHELVTEPAARLVGAQPAEVVVMSSLTVNLHLMMASFYRPTPARHRILIETGAFPSDQYAVASQARFHGYDPSEAILEAKPRSGEALLRTEDLLALIDREGDQIALVLLGNVNYLTGQAFDLGALAEAAHRKGCVFGVDLAHGAGNLPLSLHDWNVDFAAWCSYKYLNAGPGAIAGCYVHERHLGRADLPRFEGWWGHDKKTRFEMPSRFSPIPTAEAWQLSNPPILQLAALRASLELFDRATLPALRSKSERLTAYLEFLLGTLPSGFCEQVTPKESAARGAQLSLRLKSRGGAARAVRELMESGVIADFREPDIARFAPIPLYTSFSDVFHLVETLRGYALRG